jgi:hypothetical protein
VDISRANLWRNEEGLFPQGVGAVFKGVLRKKHARFADLELVVKLTHRTLIYYYNSIAYVKNPDSIPGRVL